MRRQATTSAQDKAKIDALWHLATNGSFVDTDKLRIAVAQLDGLSLDPRTQELARAANLALRGESTEGSGFPTLTSSLGIAMKKSTIERYLKELGSELTEPTRIVIGGSSALILLDLLERSTEDIDLVDEVPPVIRTMHQWRENAKARHRLYLAHFQSHYLPRNWEQRVISLGSFRKLEVFLVDPLDILVGKLFSRRVKDQADLDHVLPSVTRELFDQRLVYANRLAADKELREQADKNYYVLFGDPLPNLA